MNHTAQIQTLKERLTEQENRLRELERFLPKVAAVAVKRKKKNSRESFYKSLIANDTTSTKNPLRNRKLVASHRRVSSGLHDGNGASRGSLITVKNSNA